VADDGTILEIGGEPGRKMRGVLMPGLVNAHTHLELSALAGRVPAGLGLPVWVDVLLRLRSSLTENAMRAAVGRAVLDLIQSGTAAVAEVTSTGRAVPALEAAKVQGVVHAEVLGIDPANAQAMLAQASAITSSSLVVRPSPHAPYSTSGELIRRAVRAPGPMAMIHLDEDPAERTFLATGQGPWGALLDRLGRNRSDFAPPGCSPVSWLARLGVLGPDLALVHGVGFSAQDLDAVALAGSTVILCPRSNLHISGNLPDVAGMVARNVPLAVGTDSLASCADLDLFQELAVLREHFPQVDPMRWILAATQGGASVLGRSDLGVIAGGAAPGILHLDLDTEDPAAALCDGRRHRRRWLSCPGVAAACSREAA
jgi:cytosine/adenosine deaminase-related metal-dependent hydrolase